MLPKTVQRRLVKLCGLALIGGGLTGCFLWTTRGEGDRLMEEGAQRQERLDHLANGMDKERDELTSQVSRAREQVAELEAVLNQATQVVTRNSADLGLEVRGLREQVQALEGQLAEIRNAYAQAQQEHLAYRTQTDRQLQLISQKVGLDVSLDESEIPADADALFATATRAFENSNHSRARALFRAFIERQAQDERLDDAIYWVGKTFLAQDRPATALGEFRKVLSSHAEGNVVDDTLLAMADAFYKLNACNDAKDALNALIRGHQRSPLVARARRQLRTVNRAPRGYCRD